MPIEDFIKYISSKSDFREVVFRKVMPKKEASFGEIRLTPEVKTRLASLETKRLYTHQCLAIELVRRGKNVVVMTPTASGKSLIYNIPVMESMLLEPTSRALYIFPLKGLAQNQLKVLNELNPEAADKNAFAIYDGDTPQSKRKKLRDAPPSVILTNPDMLHLGFCAFHEKWGEFFRSLRYVIIDEVHSYRGVLGSHFAQVLRRFRRILSLYNANPVFIASSATIANPTELCETLTGLEFELISESGAGRGKKNFLFIDPPSGVSPYTVSTKIFIESVRRGLKTIAFTKARKITELMHRRVIESAPDIKDSVSSYRAGFLPEERRAIEERLFSGVLSGVISTSALELGIDIGGLDVCILAGYPGTISSTWQRSGRVGRKGKDSLIVMVSIEDALDKHFMRHPDDFFERRSEAATIDVENEPILKSHLPCAASEIPIAPNDKIYDMKIAAPLLNELASKGILWKSKLDGWHTKKRFPHRNVSIRGAGDTYSIRLENGKLLGESSGGKAFRELHPGAIYLHRANQYIVVSLHPKTREAICHAIDADFYTTPLTKEDTEILGVEKEKVFHGTPIRYGDLMITEKVIGYVKKDIVTREAMSEHLFELPSHKFKTKGIWFPISEDTLDEVRRLGFDVPGGLHAFEHAAIAALPLFALCDRMDLGGVSYTFSPLLQSPGIFIYDGYEGGVGLTKRGYDVIKDWFEATLSLMEDCACEVSCPSCTQDPQCGNNNDPLDKRAAMVMIKRWLGKK
ncbi:MAG: DEAD/DEAH box helicase [Thermodesulfobacteriota bacterium]